MDTTDQIIYGGCWSVLILYIVSTLLVFTRRGCLSYAASFLFACALWLDLTLFNIYFLTPALFQHLHQIDLRSTSDILGAARLVITSDAAEDLALMVIGWLASSLAISNSISMLEAEGCMAMLPHTHHGPLARRFIGAAERAKEYVGMDEFTSPRLSATGEAEPSRRSVVFALPRLVHAKILLPRSNSFYPSRNADEQFMSEKALMRLEDTA
ncbi:hypothetical protein F5Y15DRAFT_414364 [Xylariaceae sp. FL0016]|nr:hypothetical protein F5Y15DRAFT_414364 [Xylariaceae sp. FL0016]